MSNRHEVEGRTIHPRALKELGEEACIVALGVARDLRSGVIPPEQYNQVNYCGTACCIAGHIAFRLQVAKRNNSMREYKKVQRWANPREEESEGLANLFRAFRDADSQLAADAIERYIYDGSETPWTPPELGRASHPAPWRPYRRP